MKKFSIIIPNYNSEKWIIRLLDSITNQTYQNFEVIIVDDLSQDSSLEMILDYIKDKPQFRLYQNKRKGYNGGTRNNGVDLAKGEYILFIDCDDYLYNDKVLERVANATNNKPDCVRLPYKYEATFGSRKVILKENTPRDLVKSLFCAPWTKCVRRELFTPFPENTLIEDVSQHIEQCDKIRTIETIYTPVVVWNCLNEKAISNKKHEQENPKRINSWWRIVADLKDLNLEHDYCREHRDWRLKNYEDIIRKRLNDGV